GRGIGPGAGISAPGLDVAAAEEEEPLVVPVIAHGAPKENAAELCLGIGPWRQVGPPALDGVVTEGPAFGVENEPAGIGVVIVFLTERKSAVDGPVGADVAVEVPEMPTFVFPGRGLARSKLRPPILAQGKVVLPTTFVHVQCKLVVGAGLLGIGESDP